MTDRMSAARVGALLRKELEELRRTPSVLLPSVLTLLLTTALPFLVAVVIPARTGERLSDADDVAAGAALAARALPAMAALDPEGQAQAFLLHQFFLLQLIVPMVGAMTIATQGIVSEKQARTLEPLLATPLTTAELLTAKTLAALAPALVLIVAGLVLYALGAWALAKPGVWRTLLGPHTLVSALLLGPLATLAALLVGVIASSRVQDARTAQQFGVLVVLPITSLFLGQMFGGFLLGVAFLGAVCALLLVLDAALLWIGVRVFDRERILTRWA